jgi:tetratricopeptide (TPR) repeat protein
MSVMRGEGWFVPTLANVAGMPNSVWVLVPVAIGVLAVIFMVARSAAWPGRFMAGFAFAAVAVVSYVCLPNIGGPDEAFRKATIAERYFRPGNRIDPYLAAASGANDIAAVRRISDSYWTVADARAYAPDDFPYLSSRTTTASPTASMRTAITLQKQGKAAEAESLLTAGKEQFPFARCEFATNLAVVYFTTGRRDAALAQLESVQPLVNAASRPDCLRSQFLLGSLYHDLGRESESGAVYQRFMANSANVKDAEIQSYRKQLTGR